MFERALQAGYYFFVGGVVILGALLFLVQANLISGYQLSIVQSGSMEPTISTGSLVLVAAAEQYSVGDVITFMEASGSSIPTTHRVIEATVVAGELQYITQGDANRAVDPQPVAADDVIGRIAFSVPFLGYLLDFARQPLGFVFLIVLPVAMIALEELSNLCQDWRRRTQSRKETV